jgi:hypothetical protein
MFGEHVVAIPADFLRAVEFQMKTSASRGLTLRTKLLIGFAGVGLLVLALLVVGDHVIRESASHLETALTAQVRPLAKLNHLQSQINRIELPR